MIKKTIYILFVLLLINASGFSQNKSLKKMGPNFTQYVLNSTKSYYASLIRKGYNKQEVLATFGDVFFADAKYKKAAHWYEQLFALENAKISDAYLYRYALCLKSLENFTLSDTYMKKYVVARPNDILSRIFKEDYLEKIAAQKDAFSLQPLNINSVKSEMAPSFYKQGLVFSKVRDSGKMRKNLSREKNETFNSLYLSKKAKNGTHQTPLKFFKKINSKFNESSSTFSKDGKTVYFTRNPVRKGKFYNKNGLIGLELCKATLVNGEWGNVRVLPFNSKEYSVAHPALSKDEKTLYFASDMPGTYGGSDIFSVAILENDTYGTPVNLGEQVNTEARETFPYISENNVLYFASNGHPGLGGLDVFAKNIDDDCVTNLGSPINSPADDFGFVINETDKNGYMVSNREGGQGSDDIYAFGQNKDVDFSCVRELLSVIKDTASNVLLSNVEIKLLDKDNHLVAQGTTNDKGEILLGAKYTKGTYKMMLNKEGYEPQEKTFTVTDVQQLAAMSFSLEKEIDMSAPVDTSLVPYLDLAPVYFNINKTTLNKAALESLDKIAAYLEKHPNVKIEIRSFTDASGSALYNKDLSERRALSTQSYLLAKGVDVQRVTAVGFGENHLLNNCKDWRKCTAKQNAINRRSEFIVVE